jgi:hypothetical protein
MAPQVFDRVQLRRVSWQVLQLDLSFQKLDKFGYQSTAVSQPNTATTLNAPALESLPNPLFIRRGLYARLLPEARELFQSSVLLVRESLRTGGFSEDVSAFPIALQGSGAHAPFTTVGGLDNTWVQGRRATRFFINDNLAWTTGAHELRFGTNTRIFRLNDYDFGEGVVPLVTYTTLPQFIYGVASTASKTFPLATSQPYNFLNLDLYAQDTWKVPRTAIAWQMAPKTLGSTVETNALGFSHRIVPCCVTPGIEVCS